MKIVIAPDSFKESLSALQVATQIEAGFREIFPAAEYVKMPVADGGEGTVEAMVAATDGRIIRVPVTGPLGDPVEAFYGLTGDGQTAVIEMAAASGLMLLDPTRRNPLETTTFGVGELIRAALDQVSLSRLNHWLPRGQADPEVMQGAADFHRDIPDALLPQADPVFDDATALDAAVDMLDPQSAGVERLVGSLLRR
jgi:hypothetical protein